MCPALGRRRAQGKATGPATRLSGQARASYCLVSQLRRLIFVRASPPSMSASSQLPSMFLSSICHRRCSPSSSHSWIGSQAVGRLLCGGICNGTMPPSPKWLRRPSSPVTCCCCLYMHRCLCDTVYQLAVRVVPGIQVRFALPGRTRRAALLIVALPIWAMTPVASIVIIPLRHAIQ